MVFKGLLLVLLATAIVCYQTQGNVLVLHDSDFPKVLEQFDYIMIQFYAPWCGHCKKLTPIWTQVADQLAQQQSPIKLAKVDATVDSKSASSYKVQGYPTIFFFHKGQKIDYKGQRSKQYLLNWLLKKTRDPLVSLTQEQYEKLQSEDKVSIVFHGDSKSQQGQIINKLAIADDFNTYYVASVGKPQGTLQVFRPFDSVATYQSVDKNVEAFIQKSQRPTVVPFDDRTIGEIFSNSKPGVCLFNKAGSSQLLDAFTQSANTFIESGKQLIFTQIQQQSEHLGPFADYIKINPQKMTVVLIEPKVKSKFVLIKEASEITSEDITQFLENWSNGQAQKYGLTDQVQIIDQAATAQEL